MVFRHCERKRSNPESSKKLDCFVASLLAMTKAGRASVQQLGVVRRLRRRLDRNRLEWPAIRLGAAVRGPFGDDDQISRLHLLFLVAEPDRPGALDDVLQLV